MFPLFPCRMMKREYGHDDYRHGNLHSFVRSKFVLHSYGYTFH